MRRRLAFVLLALTFVACAAAPTVPTAGTVTSSSRPTATPAMDCLGGVPQATCDQVLPVVLAAVAPSGWTPKHVWINSGSFCPHEDCLFDPNQNFPAPVPPSGGQWVANAEIAFAETDKHAGLHVAQVGSGLVPVLIGYRVPLSTWCSGTCPSGSATDGPFRLELVLPHLDWKPTNAITGLAILSFDGSAPTTIYGSGGGVIAFSYAEVGGSRQVEPVWTADCGPHALDPATPINADLAKSGAVSGSEPDAGWLRSFLADPQVRLPSGTWDVTAIAMFVDGAGCSGTPHTMKATVRITVAG
jgi:hypothetical protein